MASAIDRSARRGVLVAEGGLGRRVPEAVHDLLHTGTGGGGERGGHVAQVVEVKVGKADAPTGDVPRCCQTASRSGPPLAPVKTQSSAAGPVHRSRCDWSATIACGGNATVRRPAADLGGPTISSPWASC